MPAVSTSLTHGSGWLDDGRVSRRGADLLIPIPLLAEQRVGWNEMKRLIATATKHTKGFLRTPTRHTGHRRRVRVRWRSKEHSKPPEIMSLLFARTTITT